MKYKVPSNIINASRLLLKALVEHHGGSSEVAEKIGTARQAVHIFERNGYVPLVQVHSVAKILHCKVWHLSYVKLMEVFGKETPDFRILVNKITVLPKEVKDKILTAYNK